LGNRFLVPMESCLSTKQHGATPQSAVRKVAKVGTRILRKKVGQERDKRSFLEGPDR